jgi:hypothetical protein
MRIAPSLRCAAGAALFAIALSAASTLHARSADRVIDDFTAAKLRCGADRFVVNDKEVGGQSHASQTVGGGAMKVDGALAPGRGMPGFFSIPLLLAPDASPHDATAFEGIKLRVKILKGSLSVQVATTDVQNFDYHSSAPLARGAGNFQEVRIPFKSLKRAWSEQTALNLKDVTSVNLVSAGTGASEVGYEITEVSFY